MSQIPTPATTGPNPLWRHCIKCRAPFDFTPENFPNLGRICKGCKAQQAHEGSVLANEVRRRNAIDDFFEQVRGGLTGSPLQELCEHVKRRVGGTEKCADLIIEILMGAVASARETGKWKTAIDAAKAFIWSPLVAQEMNRPKQQITVSEEEAEVIIREVMLRDAEKNEDVLRRLAEQRGFRLIRSSGHEPDQEVPHAG